MFAVMLSVSAVAYADDVRLSNDPVRISPRGPIDDQVYPHA